MASQTIKGSQIVLNFNRSVTKYDLGKINIRGVCLTTTNFGLKKLIAVVMSFLQEGVRRSNCFCCEFFKFGSSQECDFGFLNEH